MSVLEKLWRLLPDKCQLCKGRRGGVRGNENVETIGTLRVVMCDYCSCEFRDWLKGKERGAVNSTLDYALNSGDGTYRP